MPRLLGSLTARTCLWLSLVVGCASPERETEDPVPTVVNRAMPPFPHPAVLGKGTATRSGGPSWRPGPDLPLPMSYHASILVPTGRVLITGGDVFGAGLWAEYDPFGGEIVATGQMHHARERATATLLSDGRVLVAGGRAGEIPSETAEIYDPVSRTWAETGPMQEARWRHTATLLPSGEVLVVAGAGSEGKRLTSAELYDPNAGTFSFTDDVDEPLIGHAATALHSGDVLITGGMAAATQALVFRQATRRFELAGELSQARKDHSATLLPDGRVLVAGGWSGQSDLATAEIYDGSTFELTGTMAARRSDHQATLLPNGKVLVTGGSTDDVPVDSIEWFDPDTGRFATVKSLASARAAHAALMLPTGKVLVTGGETEEGVTQSGELFDPGGFEASLLGGSLAWRPYVGTALLPSGDVLVAGGVSGFKVAAELCHLVRGCSPAAEPVYGNGSARVMPLASGDVLFIGGVRPTDGVPSRGVELYRSETGAFEPLADLDTPLADHAACTLNDGKVLIAGGGDGQYAQSRILLLDPAAGSVTEVGSLSEGRVGLTTTTLASGEVLMAGGANETTVLASLVLYDPSTGGLSVAGALAHPRAYHTATLVNTRVLWIGGADENASVSAIERFDPTTKTLQTIGTLIHARAGHTATLLSTGKILVLGGQDGTVAIEEGELVDPDTGASELVGSCSTPRVGHATVPLPDGTVMVFGSATSILRTVDIFDPNTGACAPWLSELGSVPSRVASQLLPDGSLLLAGGVPATSEARVIDPFSLSQVSASPLHQPAGEQRSVLLDDHRVLLSGGIANSLPLATAEVFDTLARQFSPVGAMSSPRRAHAVTRLPSGAVLVTGGIDDGYQSLASAELFDPVSEQHTGVSSMLHARHSHASVLLPSGQVLIAGGLNGAVPVTEAETFDPSTNTFQPLAFATAGGPVLGTVLPNGDPLIAGNGSAFRLGWQTGALRFFSSPANPIALLPRVSGEVLVIGSDMLARLDGLGSWDNVEAQLGPSWPIAWGATVDLPSNQALLLGTGTSEPASFAFRYRRGDGVRLPIVASASADASDGPTRVMLAGARLATSPASDAMPSVSPPVVVFRSAEHGVVPMPVRSWSDQAVVAEAPATVFHGPGWVHLIVDGVPSDGRFLLLPPASNGAPCQFDAQCGSRHCVDGVCCDEGCAGPCVTCLAAHQAQGQRDGACGVVALGKDPRDACEQASADTCGQNGACDGHGACAWYEEGTACRTTGRCESGTCLRCSEARDAVLAGDSIVPCDPFACHEGVCLIACASNVDCAPGNACGVDRQCRPQRPGAAASDPGSCSLEHRGASSGAWAWWAVLVALRLARRGHGRADNTDADCSRGGRNGSPSRKKRP